MSWDPSVLRKYNTTGHFRLLNQVRSELKTNPLVRPKEGERIADVNRSKALVRAIEGRSGSGRGRRSSARQPQEVVVLAASLEENSSAVSFRDRLNAIDLR